MILIKENYETVTLRCVRSNKFSNVKSTHEFSTHLCNHGGNTNLFMKHCLANNLHIYDSMLGLEQTIVAINI